MPGVPVLLHPGEGGGEPAHLQLRAGHWELPACPQFQDFRGHRLPPPRAHPAPWPMPTWASPHLCPSPAPQWTAALDPFSCRLPRSLTFSRSTGMRPQTALGGTGQEGDAHAGHRENSQQGGVWCGVRSMSAGPLPSPVSCRVPRQLAVLLQCFSPPKWSEFRPATPHLKPVRPAFGRWCRRPKR